MSNRNSIPDFSNDLESMATTLRAMKNAMETLTAGGPDRRSYGAPRVYVQIQTPVLLGEPFKRGDLWIQTGTGYIHYWDGRLWQKVSA